MPEIRMGIYRHYKGHLYQVLGIAHDANAGALFEQRMPGRIPQPIGERTVVVYIGLELDAAHLGPRLAVRTVSDFLARVDADGADVPQGAWFDELMRPRFEYLGPELTGDMLVSPP